MSRQKRDTVLREYKIDPYYCLSLPMSLHVTCRSKAQTRDHRQSQTDFAGGQFSLVPYCQSGLMSRLTQENGKYAPWCPNLLPGLTKQYIASLRTLISSSCRLAGQSVSRM